MNDFRFLKGSYIIGFAIIVPVLFFSHPAVCQSTILNNAVGSHTINAVGSHTIYFTGNSQLFTVPDGVTLLEVEVAGASGGHSFGNGYAYGVPGLGGKVSATLTVEPGQQLIVYVGGAGQDGAIEKAGKGGYNGGGDGGIKDKEYSGGGGGGASDIRLANGTLDDRLVVAGGGGASGKYGAGGNGGGPIGAGGYGEGANPTGGNQNTGGLSGSYCHTYFAENGGFGIGGASSAGATGGGGGGGWYGGGGGAFGDGAGGSSYAGEKTGNVIQNQGGNEVNGYVTITWRKPTNKNSLPEKAVTKNNLKIFPNPTTGEFNMQLQNQSAGKAEITLQLANGATFLRRSFELKNRNATVKYSIPGQVPGVYFVIVTTATSKQTGRVVVK